MRRADPQTNKQTTNNMNYNDKINELLDAATPEQIRAIAHKAMVAAMAKGRRRGESRITDMWLRMIRKQPLRNWRDEMRFR